MLQIKYTDTFFMPLIFWMFLAFNGCFVDQLTRNNPFDRKNTTDLIITDILITASNNSVLPQYWDVNNSLGNPYLTYISSNRQSMIVFNFNLPVLGDFEFDIYYYGSNREPISSLKLIENKEISYQVIPDEDVLISGNIKQIRAAVTAKVGTVSNTITVTITNVPPTIMIDQKDFTSNIGSTGTLTVTVLPTNYSTVPIKWLSSNTNVVTIEENSGNWRGLTNGYTMLSAIALVKDGIPLTDTIKVTIILPKLFVAVGENGAGSFSIDGQNWTEANQTNGTMYSVTYGAGRFVAVGFAGGASYSIDGQNWIKADHTNGVMHGVTYGAGRFVAVGSSGVASYSTDGQNWIKADHTNGVMRGVTYGAGRFVAVGSSGVASYSTDGQNWIKADHTNGSMRDVVYGNGRFVAVGFISVASYSTDGQNWIKADHNNGSMRGVTYGAGKFVAVGTGGVTSYSTNGQDWVDASPMGGGTMESVSYQNGVFTAVGLGGKANYSTNGEDWVAFSHSNGNMFDVVSTNN